LRGSRFLRFADNVIVRSRNRADRRELPGDRVDHHQIAASDGSIGYGNNLSDFDQRYRLPGFAIGGDDPKRPLDLRP
jgi:hypothetical protein